ncbi:gamma carbonic anhydrase family protein [Actinocatenispora thailandica]|uniref:Gamma carbonic anhydrase family protein n=1 Tax=Actinocatenispora thailandica TaxID=227318 RepID=A0A7R7HXN7_9ACTN|nr:gamma carbonic anhydrase family protein [Actinocatenispora thailandica]BCJ35931.1 gamma carbonic anhydrase family protein [Actinocatenispora thailandica]
MIASWWPAGHHDAIFEAVRMSRILALPGAAPRLASGAVVLPGATVVGDVGLAADVGVWYGAVLRGDVAPVTIGAGSNVQDTAVLHADPGFPASIGERVTIGHGAVVHGATVGDDCLIGMRATVLNGARIEPGCLIAAGAVVPPGTHVPAGSLVAGVPGRVRRPVTEAETATIAASWQLYVALAHRHRDEATPA